MNLKVISQTKKVFEGEVNSVSIPGTLGYMGIFPGHTNLISTLEIGKVKIQLPNKKEKILAINGGLVQVYKDQVTILVQEAVLAEKIVKQEIDKALKNAKEKKSGDLPPSELIQLEKQIKYAKLKQKVVNRL